MKKVCINIGHSNVTDRGASKEYCITNKNDISYTFIEFNENGFNSIIALQLQKLFRDANKFLCEIVMQEGKAGYKQLPDNINLTKSDICVSLHLNSFSNEEATGFEILYADSSEEGKKLAECLEAYIPTAIPLKNRGLKPLIRKNRGGFLLFETKMPCIIIEPGFISNPRDFTILLRNLFSWDYSKAIYSGIERYFNLIG